MKKKSIVKRIFITILVLFFFYGVFRIGSEVKFNIENKYVPTQYSEDADNSVGTLSIYSRAFGPPVIWRFLGHSWVYIYNDSEEPFTISDYEVPPNTGITLGTTSMPTMEHRGIWYNLESHNLTNYGTNVGITAPINKEDIHYINTYLLEHDKWSIFYNCSNFTSDLWNKTSAGYYNKVKTGTPLILENSIKSKDDYITDGTFETEDYVTYKGFKEKD